LGSEEDPGLAVIGLYSFISDPIREIIGPADAENLTKRP
jgi:hypothetical protein